MLLLLKCRYFDFELQKHVYFLCGNCTTPNQRTINVTDYDYNVSMVVCRWDSCSESISLVNLSIISKWCTLSTDCRVPVSTCQIKCGFTLLAVRSTSSRTVSLGRSIGATPRTGTLNSRDLHLSQMTNISSGSHIISSSPPPMAQPDGQQQTLACLTPTYGSNAVSFTSSVQLSPVTSSAPPPVVFEANSGDQSLRHSQLQPVNGKISFSVSLTCIICSSR
jgi:hypothetical protein